jgi:hypothetical protein
MPQRVRSLPQLVIDVSCMARVGHLSGITLKDLLQTDPE